MLVPFFSHRPRQYFIDRIAVVFLAFAVPLFITSVSCACKKDLFPLMIHRPSYEVLFYVSFTINIVFWVALEVRLHHHAVELTPAESHPSAVCALMSYFYLF